jgi:hypothetical protein
VERAHRRHKTNHFAAPLRSAYSGAKFVSGGDDLGHGHHSTP